MFLMLTSSSTQLKTFVIQRKPAQEDYFCGHEGCSKTFIEEKSEYKNYKELIQLNGTILAVF